MRLSFPAARPSWARALATLGFTVAVLVAPARPAGAAKSIDETILDSKYRRGDYGFYLGGYRPNDWQFEQHAEVAYPVGLKVRFRLGEGAWRSWLRLEGGVSYYRRASEPVAAISIFQQPEFDGLMLAATLQAVLPRVWIARPYLGGGVIFVSLGNDFVVFRPEIYELDPENPAQYALASWKKLDVGAQVVAGLDIPLGMRAFPFVEYRHLFGVVGISDQEVKINGLSLATVGGTIETPPPLEDRDQGGRPYESSYDWGGPEVMLGLKILF